MSKPPANPKIYHITHVRNLAQVIQHGVIWSDAKRIEINLDCRVVGMSRIKQRRIVEIEVDCNPGTTVGDYTPFYFCPRSIMLYILSRGNHPDLDYTEGQEPIVHLEADFHKAVAWAKAHNRPWAFSNTNAGARYAKFFNSLPRLDRVNWEAVSADKWTASETKEGKQAEFLMHESFPWTLIERIGVCNALTKRQVEQALQPATHQPPVQVKQSWYY